MKDPGVTIGVGGYLGGGGGGEGVYLYIHVLSTSTLCAKAKNDAEYFPSF